MLIINQLIFILFGVLNKSGKSTVKGWKEELGILLPVFLAFFWTRAKCLVTLVHRVPVNYCILQGLRDDERCILQPLIVCVCVCVILIPLDWLVSKSSCFCLICTVYKQIPLCTAFSWMLED